MEKKMGMSIDEAIRHLGNYSTTHGSGLTTDKQHNEAKRVAIDIMRKYQKLEQEPREGQWIERIERGDWNWIDIDKNHSFDLCSAECSVCHKRSHGYLHDNGFSIEYKYFNFCPNCGAKMVEPQESEEE